MTGPERSYAGEPTGPGRALADAGAVPGGLHTYLSLKHGMPLPGDTRESGLRWLVEAERTEMLI
ncbi:hypothetical protein [uncultured Sphingomonas sp.]|uniref:hypothetical protein n=1 Tax=uncultured Sphingomonas sp. TaxID=158754 RepID=UPI0035CB7DD6